MLRAALFLILALSFCAAAEDAVPPAPTAPPSIVWFATEPSAIDHLVESPTVSARMVDSLVMAVTGQTDIAAAWRKLVSPKDHIGIKVSATGGRQFSTHPGVVEAILAGLAKAGIERKTVLVWDRDAADLKAAGFDPRLLRCQVRGIDLPRGWDRNAPFQAPALGKLIWGDLLFTEKSLKRLGKTPPERDQLSSTSYIAGIVSHDLTKIINVPVLADETNIGVAGALYNITVPNVDNWRRFLASEGSAIDSIPELYADEHIAPKVVLHLMDGLTAQYADGPRGNPNYAFPHATLYASHDPIALDATAARKIEGWRKESKLPSIARRIEWLDAAEKAGLGNAAEARIVLRAVTPP
jgi:uncharacterized protein (DUF362 family)